MPDLWGYCNHCQRWFYAGADKAISADDAPCPVCTYPAVCLSDRAGAEAGATTR